LHPDSFEVLSAQVSEVLPVLDLAGYVIRDAADREVRVSPVFVDR
jgi:hypothetical protein